jgi:lipoprotein signal peptidase
LKGLGLILAGGVMNIGERWLWGRVNDYWTVPIVNINNNLADWLIAVGVVVVLWELWQKTRLR